MSWREIRCPQTNLFEGMFLQSGFFRSHFWKHFCRRVPGVVMRGRLFGQNHSEPLR